VLTGTARLSELTGGGSIPRMESLAPEPVTWTDVEVLQAAFELPYSSRETTLPPGLHPTTPPLLVVLAWAVPDSDWGPFSLVQARVSCRSGVRPRGLVAGCLVDNPVAAEGLRSTWGLPATTGEVGLRRGYDAVELSAAAPSAAGPAVDLVGRDPDPLGAGDVQYTVTVTLAETPRGLRLVQLEPEYDLRRVERVRARLRAFHPGGWAAGELAPGHPVAATIAVGDVTMTRLRFVSRPEVTAFEGTETL
jgi:hypothetical protein